MTNVDTVPTPFVLGRWVIETRHKREPWELIVEPDEAKRRLAVVTGYRVEKKR